jgi:SAM-dependent methyltransferase
MLARAREVAATRGVDHVRFIAADAQAHAFPESGSDGLFSRFGVMFFADPTAAFTNLSRALVPGGRVAFACWQALADNAWIRVPMMALGAIMPLPPPPPPDAPGPGAFADRERVTGLLERAGLRDVQFEAFTPEVVLGGGIDEAVRFALDVGPTSRALAEAPPGLKEKAVAAIAEAFAPHASARGVLLASAAWIVTARR